MKSFIRALWHFIACVSMTASCGGASPSGSGEATTVPVDSQVVIFQGKIEIPTSAASSLTTSYLSVKSSEEKTKGHLYTLKGKDLGSFEADADGHYSVAVSVKDLADETAGGAFAETVIVSLENGIQNCVKIADEMPAGSADATVQLGTADVTTTLAAEALAGQWEDFNGWGGDYSSHFEDDVEFDCLYQMEKTLWNGADQGASNLQQDYGLLKDAVGALIAEGKSHDALGFSNWHSLFKGILTGDSDAFLTLNSLSAAPFALKGGMPSPDDYENATKVHNSVSQLLGFMTDEDGKSGGHGVCASISDGELDPAVLTAPIMEAENLEDVEKIYANPAAAAVHVGLVQECLKNKNCGDVKDNAAAVMSFLKEYDGNYSALFDEKSGKLDPDSLKGIVAAAKICGGDVGGAGECAKKKHEEVYDQGKGWGSVLGPVAHADDEGGNQGKTEKSDAEEIGNAGKVTICHIPPGNPANAHTIEVGSPAVAAHLAHGDSLGACPVSEPEEPVAEPASLPESVAEEPAVPVGPAPSADLAPEVLSPEEIEPAQIAEPEPELEISEESEEDEEPVEALNRIWSYTFGHIYGGFYRMIPGPSAAIGEVRPDLQGLEVATGNEEYYPLGYAGPMGRWFLFQADGSVVFWKDTQNDEAHSSVNLADLNGDGNPEMLGGTTSGNQIQAFDGYGNWTWKFYLWGHSIGTPAVADLGAGDLRVFAGTMDTYIRSLKASTGALMWQFYAGGEVWSSGAVADVNGDGKKELVIAADGQSGEDGTLYCLDAKTGSGVWERTLPGQTARASAAISDLNGDGTVDVLIGDAAGTFHSFSGKTGASQWSFATGGEIISSAAVGDLDGDGDLEVVFGSESGSVYALNADGTLFWRHEFGSAVHSSPALARRGPADRLDVYVGTMGGEVAVLNGVSGETIASIEVGYEVVSSPVVGDVDGDGKLEVFFQDRRGDFFNMQGDVFWAVRDESSDVAEFAREWPLFRGNAAHTGVYSDGE